jgi:fatty-acyl-CoA synthase
MMLTMLLSGTVVVSRRFDPEHTLALIERERCQVLVAVPTMLRRIMDLPAAARRQYDTTCLRVVAVSGSAMSAGLARSFMDEFGEILFSLYGSTEAAFATVAGPADLRDAPGGRASIVNGAGTGGRRRRRGRATGHSGRILVAAGTRSSPMADDARQRGTNRDLGWFDDAGRLSWRLRGRHGHRRR